MMMNDMVHCAGVPFLAHPFGKTPSLQVDIPCQSFDFYFFLCSMLSQETAVNEYLHFHYGPTSGVLQRAFNGNVNIVTSAFERVKDSSFGFGVSVLKLGWRNWTEMFHKPSTLTISYNFQGVASFTSLPNLKDVCVQHTERFGHALDVGCAVGRMSFGLSEHFLHVDGIDSSMAFIEAASTLQRGRAVPYTIPGGEEAGSSNSSQMVLVRSAMWSK